MEYPKKLKAFEPCDFETVAKGARGGVVVILGVGVVLLGVTEVPISLYLYFLMILDFV